VHTPHSGHPGHPEHLVAADRPYLAPWGRREMLRASAICAAATATALGLAAWQPWFALFAPIALAFWAILILFFRNPRRSVPQEPGLLVAPADGTIWDIEAVDEPEFVAERCLRIGIFLSVFDIHVNRAPCDASLVWSRHREGQFRDARSPEAGRVNESTSLGLTVEEAGRAHGTRLLLRQVSGAIARRIVTPVEIGNSLARGGLIGMIKYGSRTELWVPLTAGFEVAVAKGDKVRGGETVLGRFVADGAA